MAKIFLCEDDPLLVRLYQEKFTNDGYQMETALNGEEGLTKMKQTKPDLVLLDIMMPKMDGLEVLAAMKKDPDLKGIPVILLTNVFRGKEDVNRGLEMGAVAYLVKSDVTPAHVVAKVKEILAAHTKEETPTVREVPK